MEQKAWSKATALALLLQRITPVLAGAQSAPIQRPKACAVQCKDSKYNPAGWTTFGTADYFQKCNYSPALFTYDIENQAPPTVIRVCEDSDDPEDSDDQNEPANPLAKIERRCAPPPEFDVQVSRTPAKDPSKIIPGQAMGAALTIKYSLLRKSQSQDSRLYNSTQAEGGVIVHAHWADAVVGVYIGAEVDPASIANGPLDNFISGIEAHGIGQTLQTESCAGNNSASTFGIIADTSSGVEALMTVRSAVKAWSKGQCADTSEKAYSAVGNVTATVRASGGGFSKGSGQAGNWTGVAGLQRHKANSTLTDNPAEVQHNQRIFRYALQECTETQVQSEDNCEKLAKKCDITLNQFMSYNHQPDCIHLQINQRVCCSEGELPDIRPKKQPNGDCAVHYVVKGDTCSSIAKANGITLNDLLNFNKNTWGWNGCDPDKFFPDKKICVSQGESPFPAADPGAVCGPTKPGTSRPAGSTSKDWGLLNECPLKACCNIWGKCGMSDDFCIDKSSGAPGSSTGLNGCVANCGLSITNNQKRPAEFRSVGYFETWNFNRECLKMDVDDIPSGKYTHVHYAFADLSPDYKVGVVQDQFDRFRTSSKGYKKILAFGGWDFSTEPKTAHIFRNGVAPGNREQLASSLAAFILQNNLDGIDFDWEYPGVPDMNWLPPSSASEAPNYLEFLRLMRAKLPNKSISIAAPASYWYLKAFPIKEISEVVNYIVYMTYDLHGQWDHGNEWAQPGCKLGNCLRDHVDLKETKTALAMITKAGVSADKITVGISSYGRQFKMTNPSCTGPQCTYVGPESKGTRGRCTNETAYISNAEIKEIIAKNPSAKVVDSGGNSKILTYDGNWVSFMDDKDKMERTKLWKSMNFGGTIDWAIDLNSFDYDNSPNVAKATKNRKGKLEVSKGGLRNGGGGDALMMADTCQQDGSWRDVMCSAPGISDYKRMPFFARWANLKANDAWCAAIKNWTALRESGSTTTSFTDTVIGDFLKGDTPFNCEVLNQQTLTGCIAARSCRDKDAKSAASMQLLSLSLQNINSNFVSIYQGLNDASIHKEKPLKAMSALIPKPDHSMEIILNVLATAIGFGSVSFFNGFVKTGAAAAGKAATEAAKAGTAAEKEAAKHTDEFLKVAADNAKDYTNILINTGLRELRNKEKSLGDKQAKDVRDRIAGLWEDVVMEWKQSLSDMNAALFSGSESSIELLTRLIKDGNSLDRAAPLAIDVQNSTTKFLASIMVPEVWRMQDFYPVLLDTGFPCGTEGIGIGQWTDKKNVGDAEVCLTNEGGEARGKEFQGGRQYQLWAVKGGWGDQCKCAGSCGVCKCTHYLTGLPGLGQIRKPVKDWGGISIFDMINSAKDGIDKIWNGNHKYTDEDATNADLLMKVSGGDNYMDIHKLPGIVNIPSCSWADVKANWAKGITKENKATYPCF